MHRCIRNSVLALFASLAAMGALAQSSVSLRSGESVDLQAVYWVSNCQSTLDKIAGVDLLEGPSGLRLHVREEQVIAKRQNCPNMVPGGTVVLTAENVPEKVSGLVKYRVRYDTQGGSRQSSHSVQVDLYPPK